MTETIVKDAEEHMKKAVLTMVEEFKGLRTSRASASLLDRIFVDCYGAKMPVNQVATILSPEPQLLVIQPWDKSILRNIEKAIQQSDLGITPTNDGNVIRLPIPPLTEERRKELAKIAKKYAEEGRVAIRNIRRHTNDILKNEEKEKKISEDELLRTQERIQKLTDKNIHEIDELLAAKEKEIMEI